MTSIQSNLRICKACGIWKLASDDVYCSYCGERVAKITATLSDNIIYFRRLGAYGELILSLENEGQTDITIENIVIEHDWVKPIYDESIIYPSNNKGVLPCLIPAEGKWDIPLKIELTQTNSYYQCNVSINTVAGTEQVKIDVLPQPKFILHIEYPFDDKDKSKIKDVKIELDQPYTKDEMSVCYLIRSPGSGKELWNCRLEICESLVNIESIGIEAKEKDEVRKLSSINIISHQKMPINLDPDGIRGLNFNLEIDADNLPKGENIYFFFAKCSKIQEQIIGKFIIANKKRSEIEFLTAYDDVITLQDEFLVRRKDDTKDISIDIFNSSDLTISIVDINIDSDWLEMLSEIPKSLRAEQTDKLQFFLHTGKFLEKLIETNESIQINANLVLKFHCLEYPDYLIPDRYIKIIAEVNLMPEYDGIVAIDFGTSNSCCAVEGRAISQQSNMVPLESISPLIPSVIFYKNENGGVYDYAVGSQALAFSMMPDTSQSTVKSIKRKLGQKDYVGVMLDKTKRHIRFLPEHVAGHIIQHIIDTTERHLQRRIKRCVVTHPARFFRPQIKALEEAFSKGCGIEVSAFINEAVASALDAILEQESNKKTEYTIIVYDFGGGTTDIALLKVKDFISEDGIREIIPETLGVDGKRRLGGDDITNKLAELIISKCVNLLKSSGMGELLYKPIENIENNESIQVPEDIDIIELRNAININMLNIINSAEEHKKRLAIEGEPKLPLMNLNFISLENKIESYPFSIEVTLNDMNEIIEDDITSAMNLAWDLVNTANDRDKLSIDSPDIFVLSGMSSRLPIVKDLAEKVFPKSKVWLHPEPKECVARGAYRIHAMSELPAMISIDTEFLKSPPPTSAQYGIMVYGTGGEPIFRKAIPKGAKLPAEGVISGFRIGRKTSITVYENPGTSMSDPEIRKIAVCRLNVPESVSDRELRGAQLFMRLEDEMTLKIILKVADKEHEFLAEVEPYI